MSWFGIASYGLAALAYAAITAVLIISHPGGRRASWVTLAAGMSLAWAAAFALLLLSPQVLLASMVTLDALHVFIWTACILAWLSADGAFALPGARWLLAASAALGLWSVAVSFAAPAGSPLIGTVYPALLGMALIGLLAVEQVFRNTAHDQRERLRLLCLGVGAIFATDLFVYSQATLLGNVMPAVWQGRGLINAALAPLILLGVKRQSEWERELFVSRQIAFYTASLIGVGGYLLAMSLVAYVLRAVGGQWGVWLQIAFLAAALVLLAVLLFTSSIRARLRVFLVKHFYKNKYDYREEWLRLTAALGRTGELSPLAQNALAAIAGIVGSRSGGLWLKRDESYELAAALSESSQDAGAFTDEHPVVAFLRERDWVIDSEQYARDPGHYGHAFGPPEDDVLPRESIIVPLDCQGHLQGFVILGKPPGVQSLNFEDHDILRTAGSQAAVVLAQALAQEQLTRTRQFEAVNKLSTFLMHDLKNVIAQQELVVANAQRFRHRQEFVDDAIETVRSGVERMRHILEQLRGAARGESRPSRADVSRALTEVGSSCADRAPVPDIDGTGSAVWAAMERERLVSCLTHLVRNAQDATPADGHVRVSLERAGDEISVTVADDGQGMDEAFIRERLFRPFDSTKGAKGMGIGAYQVREAVRASGGDVEVRSRPGEGTTVRVRLPAASGGPGSEGWEETAA